LVYFFALGRRFGDVAGRGHVPLFVVGFPRIALPVGGHANVVGVHFGITGRFDAGIPSGVGTLLHPQPRFADVDEGIAGIVQATGFKPNRQAVQDNGRWRFSVKDSGIGIASEDIAKIDFFAKSRVFSRSL
jgi:hypothetical protein